MPDTNDTNDTNDIDSLLRILSERKTNGCYFDQRYHAALTALVAERDNLRQIVAIGERQLRLANLHQRNTEAEANDRDLRERLVCAALNGILSEQRGLLNHEYALRAIGLADATLAAMRKGEQNGK